MIGKIINNKIVYPPVNDGNKMNVYNDEQWLQANCFHELTEEELKSVREADVKERKEKQLKAINKRCDNAILNDFKWKDNEFYLSMENQMNFANLYTAKDLLTYPQTIKTKTGYIELQNAEEVTEFYLAGVNFIKETLEKCWKEKQRFEK